QQGFHQTGINQIIKEAEIARGSLYQHFSGKDELCVEYLEYMHNNWFRDITTFVSNKKSSKAKLLGLFDFLEHYAPEENFRGCFFLNIVTEVPDTATDIYKTALAKKEIFKKYIEELVAQHTGNQNDPLAEEIYMLFEGAVSELQFRKQTWPVVISKNMAKKIIP
ncbi:MAG: TetR/AcrR family transcriptional regulator, partial [Balneolaceae bacterium]|nr:TetR/AcrR family transcriptional regulator [Balneolaceae bacterium]